jgi:nicotinamide-nucleotide amidase
MRIEIICIGDELLIGQTVNTNASWLGQTLGLIGAQVVKSSCIADDMTEIISALDGVSEGVHAVIITGGLGPTKDDITKHTLCNYFNTSLEIHQPTLEKIQAFFASRNRPMLESNNQQAELPKECTILANNYGTAAGMWFEKNEIIYISLPGVPYEMKAIVSEEVVPRFQDRFQLNAIYYKTALTQGLGESFLAEKIKDWEDSLKTQKLGLAYLPSPGIVKLRVTSNKGQRDNMLISKYFDQLKELIPEYLFGFEDDSLPKVLAQLLVSKQKTLGTVESCTAGLLANQLTSLPGASAFFMGSLVTYSNELKVSLAEVNPKTIASFGSVSEQTAIEMAIGGRIKLGVDYCISTTGIAGPGGGSDLKPVGMVWIGFASEKTSFARQFRFGDNRERNILMTVLSAQNLLRINLD